MAAKIWYKHLKVGDRVQVSLDKNHLWKENYPNGGIGKIHSCDYGYFTVYMDEAPHYFVIIDYLGAFNHINRDKSYNYNGSIIKKLPKELQKLT